MYSSWFGLDSPEVYYEKSFVTQYKDKGKNYWEARKVLFDFIYGIECGYVKNFMPSTGFSLDEETVYACLEKLSYEWKQEQKGRGGTEFRDSPNFIELLEPNQKLALVETLLHHCPEWATNAKTWKNKKDSNKLEDNTYLEC
ncbi:MAG: hypothetical protein AABY07_10725 [Nanoarchaeota archaeon]